MIAEPLLRLDQLEFGFSTPHGYLPAVDGVSLDIAEGEVVGLVGESGSGKSTLGRLALRMYEPSAGTVTFEGEDITQLKGERLRRKRAQLQMVFQDPVSSLDPRMRAWDAIAEPLRELGFGNATQIRARVEEVVGLVRLDLDLTGRFPRELSGGQAQRVSLARALSVAPRLIVADEPVSALDATTSAQIVALMRDLKHQLGVSFLFVSHDLGVVRSLCDRVAVMYLGRIVESGTTEEVFERPQHPYTAALLSASRSSMSRDGTRRERIILTGELPDPTDPPSGCRFRNRCPIGPKVHPGRTRCIEVEPTLAPTSGAGLAACHFSERTAALVADHT